MIFLGDVAHPLPCAPEWFSQKLPWREQAVAINLEGALSDNLAALRIRKLFNHSSIISRLLESKVRIASLANNHVTDLGDQLESTIATLEAHGIATVGAGRDLAAASAPAIVHDECEVFLILAFGWSPIGCKTATPGRPGVNPLQPSHLLRTVERERHLHPDAQIVVQVHWNYEMELYPHPAHRQLAFAAIEAGASAVIGHHPHRVGGFELYDGKPIAYSLGNWWLPQGFYFDGQVKYGGDALTQLALEWHPRRPPTAHWFAYSPERHVLSHLSSESATESEELARRTPFAGTAHGAYCDWFREHRIKRRTLPIFLDYRTVAENHIKASYVQLRHLAVVALERTGLRSRLGL